MRLTADPYTHQPCVCARIEILGILESDLSASHVTKTACVENNYKNDNVRPPSRCGVRSRTGAGTGERCAEFPRECPNGR